MVQEMERLAVAQGSVTRLPESEKFAIHLVVSQEFSVRLVVAQGFAGGPQSAMRLSLSNNWYVLNDKKFTAWRG